MKVRSVRPVMFACYLILASFVLMGWKCPGSPLVHVTFTGGPQAGPSPLFAQFQGDVSVSPPLVLEKFRGDPDDDDDLPPVPDKEPEPVRVISWLWDFGDGTTGTGQNTNHTYTEEGCYDVTLTVVLSNGMSGSKTRKSYICVESNPLPPVADAGPDQTVCTFEEVQLDGSNSSDPNGDPLTYDWEFQAVPPGSNVDDTWLSDSTAVDPTFVPDLAGAYTLLLNVSDGTDTDDDTVVITAEDPQVSMIPVANSFFTQGPSQTEIDALVPEANELPPFGNETSDYNISEVEVTNCLFTFVLNYANAQGHLDPPLPKVFPGGNVMLNGQILLQIEDILGEPEFCDIEYDTTHNIFFIARRDDQSMAHHPVVEVSWYGALAFCNWLSELEQLGPVYDLTIWDFNFMNFGGYRLGFESEWEYAAAWEELLQGGQHHIWGFVSSLLLTDISTQRVNHANTNPLGLTAEPRTTPVGYYNGANGTINSQSPVGCYDMSGNVWEWIYQEPYPYGQIGRKGDDVEQRLIRSGSYGDVANDCRTARREGIDANSTLPTVGFRIFQDQIFED